MIAADKEGIPLSSILDSAQKAEVKLALQTVDNIEVSKRPLHPRRKPKRLCADKGYDAEWLREELRRRRINPQIPKRRKPSQLEAPRMSVCLKEAYGNRWVVERTFAWLGWKRRLLIRWERNIITYQAFFNIACMMICLKEVLK